MGMINERRGGLSVGGLKISVKAEDAIHTYTAINLT